MGLEPTASAVTERRSTLLNYRAKIGMAGFEPALMLDKPIEFHIGHRGGRCKEDLTRSNDPMDGAAALLYSYL